MITILLSRTEPPQEPPHESKAHAHRIYAMFRQSKAAANKSAESSRLDTDTKFLVENTPPTHEALGEGVCRPTELSIRMITVEK